MLLLPVRRESAAADTRREYVRVRPFSGLQAGPRSFPLSDVCPCPGLPSPAFPGKSLFVLRELTPMVLTLQSEAESGPPCALRPFCYGPVAPCPFP